MIRPSASEDHWRGCGCCRFREEHRLAISPNRYTNTLSSETQERSSGKKNSPDVLPISRRPQRRQRRRAIRLGVAEHRGPAARGLRRRGRRGARLAAQLVEVLEVALGHGGDVLPAEDAHLEVLARARRELGAAGLEVVQVLVDDLVGADVPGDVEAVAAVGDELAWGGEVDTAVRDVVSRDDGGNGWFLKREAY